MDTNTSTGSFTYYNPRTVGYGWSMEYGCRWDIKIYVRPNHWGVYGDIRTVGLLCDDRKKFKFGGFGSYKNGCINGERWCWYVNSATQIYFDSRYGAGLTMIQELNKHRVPYVIEVALEAKIKEYSKLLKK